MILVYSCFAQVELNSVVINSTGVISIANVTARSGSAADIQSAVNTVIAAGGGTVYIPEGDWQCNQTVNGAIQINLKLLPAGAWLNIIGSYNNVTALTNYGFSATMPATILRSTVSATSGNQYIYTFKVIGAANKHIRISGISILGSATNADQYHNSGIFMQLVDGFRIDHCYLDSGADADIFLHMCKGLVDHTVINQTYSLYMSSQNGEASWGVGIYVFGDSMGSATWVANLSTVLGTYDWAGAGYPYTAGPVYIEDCAFSYCRHAIASAQYAYYVVRYCTFLHPRIGYNGTDVAAMQYLDVHGIGPGGRGLEAYNNTFRDALIGLGIRGGGGVVFNNTFIDIGVQCMFIMNEVGNLSDKQCPNDLWIWNNTVVNYRTVLYASGLTGGVNYYTDSWGGPISATSPAPPKPSYTPYSYPHPYAQPQA